MWPTVVRWEVEIAYETTSCALPKQTVLPRYFLWGTTQSFAGGAGESSASQGQLTCQWPWTPLMRPTHQASSNGSSPKCTSGLNHGVQQCKHGAKTLQNHQARPAFAASGRMRAGEGTCRCGCVQVRAGPYVRLCGHVRPCVRRA